MLVCSKREFSVFSSDFWPFSNLISGLCVSIVFIKLWVTREHESEIPIAKIGKTVILNHDLEPISMQWQLRVAVGGSKRLPADEGKKVILVMTRQHSLLNQHNYQPTKRIFQIHWRIKNHCLSFSWIFLITAARGIWAEKKRKRRERKCPWEGRERERERTNCTFQNKT